MRMMEKERKSTHQDRTWSRECCPHLRRLPAGSRCRWIRAESEAEGYASPWMPATPDPEAQSDAFRRPAPAPVDSWLTKTQHSKCPHSKCSCSVSSTVPDHDQFSTRPSSAILAAEIAAAQSLSRDRSLQQRPSGGTKSSLPLHPNCIEPYSRRAEFRGAIHFEEALNHRWACHLAAAVPVSQPATESLRPWAPWHNSPTSVHVWARGQLQRWIVTNSTFSSGRLRLELENKTSGVDSPEGLLIAWSLGLRRPWTQCPTSELISGVAHGRLALGSTSRQSRALNDRQLE